MPGEIIRFVVGRREAHYMLRVIGPACLEEAGHETVGQTSIAISA